MGVFKQPSVTIAQDDAQISTKIYIPSGNVNVSSDSLKSHAKNARNPLQIAKQNHRVGKIGKLKKKLQPKSLSFLPLATQVPSDDGAIMTPLKEEASGASADFDDNLDSPEVGPTTVVSSGLLYQDPRSRAVPIFHANVCEKWPSTRVA